MKVLDTLTNKVTIFNSIDEAAQSIDCSVTAIRKALQNVKQKGAPAAVSRLLKRRYIVATDNFSALRPKALKDLGPGPEGQII